MALSEKYDGSFFREGFKNIKKHSLPALAGLWDVALWLVFIIAGLAWIDFSGQSLYTYCGFGFLYSFTAARRWVKQCPQIISYASLSIFIPCYFIFFDSERELFWGMNDLIAFPVCFFIARSPLYWAIQKKQSFLIQQKNRIFLIVLHGLYGLLIQIYNPSFLEKMEWKIHPSFKLGSRYHSTTHDLRLYYEDIHQAEKIDLLLPEIVESLKKSPFFTEASRLVLCQKNNFINPYHENDNYDNFVLGHYHPWKRYSYVYLSSPKEWDSHDYKAVIVHELTHQMVHQFYGVWAGLIRQFPLWKDEGYAEYIAHQGNFESKKDLLNLIETDRELANRLSCPFSPDKEKSDYVYQDYQAALIQTRYALDYKKTETKDFFSCSHALATLPEIQKWLAIPEE